MASTYENDLRLEEMATGENSGSWGTKTNTNLELIADAFSYGTETIADADTTITIADGAADAARSLALKINSSEDLTTTRTVTLAPNTTSKVWIIENNTSGGQTLTISAGSGSNVTLPNGVTKIIATDGIGAAANVTELYTNLHNITIDGVLSLADGTNSAPSLTNTGDTNTGLYFPAADEVGITVGGTQVLKADSTGIDVTGTVTMDGGSTSADFTFGDNDKAIFGGATSELHIYSNGSHSYIDDVGDGVLILQTNGNNVSINSTGKNMGVFTKDAEVTLYYNNAAKLATAATGVDITGTLYVPEYIEHSSDSNTYFGFPGGDQFAVITAGQNRLKFVGSETVFNEDGEDKDFRVESDSNANMLFVDAGQNNVGIGKAPGSGQGTLQIAPQVAATNYYRPAGNYALFGDSGGNGEKDWLYLSGSYTDTDKSVGFAMQDYNGNFGNYAGSYIRTNQAKVRIGHFVGGANSGTAPSLADNFIFDTAGGAVFNERGENGDFRVESDSEVNMLLVDAGDNKVLVNTNLTSTQDVEPSTPAPMSVKNGLFLFRDLSTSGNDRNLLNLDTNGGWASTGNIGTYTNIRWSNGASSTMGQFGLTYGSSTTVTGANSEFAIQGLFHTNYGNSGVVAAFGANQSTKFMGGVTVNENGNDQDFRVESDTNTHALFVDASNNLVSVGASIPSYGSKFSVSSGTNTLAAAFESSLGGAGAACSVRMGVSTRSNQGLQFTSVGAGASILGGSLAATIYNTEAAQLALGGNNVYNQLILDSDEIVVNEGSANTDFRVESDNATHALFVEADSAYVKFGKSSDSTGEKFLGVMIGCQSSSANGRIGSTSNSPSWFSKYGSNGDVVKFHKTDGTNLYNVGSISVDTTSTSYNTSSDYRLKENVVDLTGATTRLKQLEPKRFNFIANADTTVDGFLAHEAQTVVPEAVTGTHNEVDADGNPVYQGIDQSKLVPLLVATIKELEARITALENA